MLTILRDPVTEVAADAGLETRPGKEVLEICILGIDKGTAIRELLGSAPAAAFYAGDDTGDLPALCGEEVPGSGALPGSGTAAVVDLEAPFPGPVAHLRVPAASGESTPPRPPTAFQNYLDQHDIQRLCAWRAVS